MIVYGVTRWVLLTRNKAFKFPALYSWELFLQGLLANIQEYNWWNWTKDSRLCPVLFFMPLGIMVVMPRADKVTTLPRKKLYKGLPLDYKAANFGRLGENIVLIDYGS